ncbi:hypothetical protein HOH87_05390 [bacterium]|jgi:hypothetical protein|nr:hypothetical protein [bacterium]
MDCSCAPLLPASTTWISHFIDFLISVAGFLIAAGIAYYFNMKAQYKFEAKKQFKEFQNDTYKMFDKMESLRSKGGAMVWEKKKYKDAAAEEMRFFFTINFIQLKMFFIKKSDIAYLKNVEEKVETFIGAFEETDPSHKENRQESQDAYDEVKKYIYDSVLEYPFKSIK